VKLIKDIRSHLFNIFLTYDAIKKGSWDSIFLKNREGEIDEDNVVAKPYSKADLVYTVISTTAKAIAQVPWIIEKRTTKDKYESVGVNNQWMKLIARPNEYMDEYSFKESLVSYLMLDGHVFSIKFPPTKFMPDYLWVIPKKYMTYELNKNTNRLIHWNYKPTDTGKSIAIYPNELASIWLWNPDDQYLGLSPLKAGKIDLMIDYRAGRHTQNVFDEGAIPGGVLTTEKKLLPKNVSFLREQWEARHQGYKKSHRIAVLDQGLKYQQIGFSNQDIDLLNLRSYTRKSILQIFGMKESVLEAKGGNYAVAKQDIKQWWKDTNLSIMKLITSALNFALFGLDTTYRLRFKVETIEALQEDHLVQARTANYYFRMAVPFNEINKRLDLGFNDIPGGDIGYLPGNVVPVNNVDSDEGSGKFEEKFRGSEEFMQLSDSSNSLLDEWKKHINKCVPLINDLQDKLSRVIFDLRVGCLKMLTAGEDIKYLLKKSIDYLDKNVPIILRNAFFLYSWEGNKINSDNSERLDILFIAKIINNIITYDNCDDIRKIFNTFHSKIKKIAYLEVMDRANYSRNQYISKNYKRKTWFTPVSCLKHKNMHGCEICSDDSWTISNDNIIFYPCDLNGNLQDLIGCQCVEVGKDRR